MLIIFDKTTGKRLNDFGKNELFPDGVPYDPQPNEIVYRIHDNDPRVEEYLAGDVANVTATIVDEKIVNINIPVASLPVPPGPQPPSIEERTTALEDAMTVIMGI